MSNKISKPHKILITQVSGVLTELNILPPQMLAEFVKSLGKDEKWQALTKQNQENYQKSSEQIVDCQKALRAVVDIDMPVLAKQLAKAEAHLNAGNEKLVTPDLLRRFFSTEKAAPGAGMLRGSSGGAS